MIKGGRFVVVYTSLWFTGKYPNAKIIAIEPEGGNYKVLEENTKNYKNIERIKAGLWHRNTFLQVVDKGDGEWGFMTDEIDQGLEGLEWDVKAIDLNTILKNSGCEKIDVLKLDVEGAKREIFSTNCDWLSKVNILIIELHDRMKKGCTESFLIAVNKYRWVQYIRGEHIILVKESPVTEYRALLIPNYYH